MAFFQLHGNPVVLFECKLSDEAISMPMVELSAQLGDIPHIQLLRKFDGDLRKGAGRMVQADRFLANLV